MSLLPKRRAGASARWNIPSARSVRAEGAAVDREQRERLLVARAAAEGLAEVQDEIAGWSSRLGRSDLYWRLEGRARALVASASARDQIAARAYACAAEDMTWDRPPLLRWTTFLHDRPPTAAERAAVRERVPAADASVAAKARALGLELERRILDGGRLEAVLEAGRRLEEAAVLQRLMWDDPRIEAGPRLRRVMCAAADDLETRARLFRSGASAGEETGRLARAVVRGLRRWRRGPRAD